METKGERLRRIVNKLPVSSLEPPLNTSQEVYRKKLVADVARTKKFIHQANSAIEKLQQQIGACPYEFDESKIFSQNTEDITAQSWTPELLRQAHTLAHYEVYRQMPYQPMKNDLIGIATALTLTLENVYHQEQASALLKTQNEAKKGEIASLQQVLADYKLAHSLIKERIRSHPERMAQIQRKIDDSSTYEALIESKVAQITQLSEMAKSREETLHLHLQKVVMRIFAMTDWGSEHPMDENTFKKSLAKNLGLLKSLIAALGDDLRDKWVDVPLGTAEERLVEAMVRNNLLLLRKQDGLQIRLRDYGLP